MPRWTRNNLCSRRRSPSRPRGKFDCAQSVFRQTKPTGRVEACVFCHCAGLSDPPWPHRCGQRPTSDAAGAVRRVLRRPRSTRPAAQRSVSGRDGTLSHRQRQLCPRLSCAALPGPGSVCPAEAIYGLAAMRPCVRRPVSCPATCPLCRMLTALYLYLHPMLKHGIRNRSSPNMQFPVKQREYLHNWLYVTPP